MWITWAVIILAIAMVVGPIMLVRPTPGTNKIAKIRSLANQKGLTVRLNRPSNGNGAEVKGAIYSIPISSELRKNQQAHWTLQKRNYVHDLHFHGMWDWEGKGQAENRAWAALSEILSSLPEGISAVEYNASGIGCSWDEKCRGMSEEIAVEEVKNWLQKIAAALV